MVGFQQVFINKHFIYIHNYKDWHYTLILGGNTWKQLLETRWQFKKLSVVWHEVRCTKPSVRIKLTYNDMLGAVANVLDYDIVISEFKPQSCY